MWSRLARQVLWSYETCFSKCDDNGFVVFGEVVECGKMFRGEHGAGIEDTDEEVCVVGGTWIGFLSS